LSVFEAKLSCSHTESTVDGVLTRGGGAVNRSEREPLFDDAHRGAKGDNKKTVVAGLAVLALLLAAGATKEEREERERREGKKQKK
jgi:hypothetical protein